MCPGKRLAISANAARPDRIVREVADVIERIGRADLADQATARLVVSLHGLEHRADVRDHEVLESLGQDFAGRGIAGGKGTADISAIVFRFARQEIAANPRPERTKRGTCDTALQFVRGIVVGQEEFNRPEKLPVHIVAARRGLTGPAQDAAQFLQQNLAARDRLAALPGTFELLDQQSPRCRRELLEVFLQSLDRQPVGGHPATHEFMKTKGL